MIHQVSWLIVTNVSEAHNFSIFRVKISQKSEDVNFIEMTE
jgi:hypothetical protein